jgi:DNA-binding NarL/FixJ family response regulator
MNVLLVDDHPLLCDAIEMLFARHWPRTRVRSCGSLAQALAQVQAHAPELVLLDLALPDSRELQALCALREACPQAQVVVLSADDRAETVTAAIEAGAAGYVVKTADAPTLQQALQTVLDGGVALPASCIGDVHALAVQRHHAAALQHDLSERQRDVLRLLIQGKANKEISRALDLSESTVKTHIAALFRKLDVSNRTQAVLAAARLGLRLTPSGLADRV